MQFYSGVDIREYQAFVLQNTIEDTPENRAELKAKCDVEKLEFEALSIATRENIARDYTCLCKAADKKAQIM